MQNVVLNGESMQNGEPSLDNAVEIENVQGKVTINADNKNLIRTNIHSGNVNGITYVVNADNSVTLNGTATAATYIDLDLFHPNILQVTKAYYTLSSGIAMPQRS